MNKNEKARIEIPSDIRQQARELTRGAREVLPNLFALELKLLQAREAKRPLNIKLGIDPTGFDVHIGHGVPLRALARFEKAGHNAQLLLGGATAQIGDPTGRDAARTMQTADEVHQKGATFVQQIRPILPLKPQNIFNNADWQDRFEKNLMFLFQRLTLNPFLGKEAFAKRLDAGKPVFWIEAVYPMMQGFDSVELHADVEIGGTDQRFNLLMGRQIQPLFGQEPQVVIMFDLLEGTDGVPLLDEEGKPAIGEDGKPKFRKMSKSFDNTINLTDAPNDIFGKAMRLPDVLIERFFNLATTVDSEQITREAAFLAGGGNPRDAKERLAKQLVFELHGPAAAEAALSFWRTVHTQRSLPTDMPSQMVPQATALVSLLVETGLAESKTKARGLIKQGGVRLDDEKVTDEGHVINLAPGEESVLKVGKQGKFLKLVGKPAA
jgi:tyrosyl-tRNA synthetase